VVLLAPFDNENRDPQTAWNYGWIKSHYEGFPDRWVKEIVR
jgi:hypothetical protein